MLSGKVQESILITFTQDENPHQDLFVVCQKGSQQRSPPEKVQRSVILTEEAVMTLTLG